MPRNKVKFLSGEHKQKISAALRGNTNCLGHKCSDETKSKISAAKKGKPLSECNKRALSESLKGKPSSRKGRNNSEKHNQKLSEAAKKNWQDPVYREKLLPHLRKIHENPKYFDTPLELTMQEVLRNAGIGFRVQEPILGTPDIYIPLDEIHGICVMVDGGYCHADPRKYEAIDKIYGKLAQKVWDYDSYITKSLESQGYIVLRFWEEEIVNDINYCITQIQQVMGVRNGA